MDTIAVAHTVHENKAAAVLITNGGTNVDTPGGSKRQLRSAAQQELSRHSPMDKSGEKETVGGGVTLKLEPGLPPKLQRTTSRKVERRPPPLFLDYEDKTTEATSVFSLVDDCIYANKYMGLTESALECDCTEEWGKSPTCARGAVCRRV